MVTCEKCSRVGSSAHFQLNLGILGVLRKFMVSWNFSGENPALNVCGKILTSKEGQCEMVSAMASAASIPSDIPSSFSVFNSFNCLIASQILFASSAVDIFRFFSATSTSHDTVLSSSINDISISFTLLNEIKSYELVHHNNLANRSKFLVIIGVLH